jgi:hypothetical protein
MGSIRLAAISRRTRLYIMARIMTFMAEKIDFDKEIPNLSSYAFELANLTLDMLKQSKHNEYDHLAFMTSTFVCKQLGHIKSVLALIDYGQYKDALIIARVMIEGYAILRWANKEPTERPLNWRAYILIDQFRRSFGRPDYAEHQEYLEVMLDKYCRKYLRDEYKTKQQRDIVPDNYLGIWRRDDSNDKKKFITIPIEKIFEDVGLKETHDHLYDPASGWLHWDSFSMAETIERKADGGIICGLDPKYLGASAIASGMQALIESASLLDQHLGLGFSARLKDLHKRIEEGTEIKSKNI